MWLFKQFNYQHCNSKYQGHYKHAFCSLVTAGVDENSEEHSIGNEGYAGEARKEAPVLHQQVPELAKGNIQGVELNKIIPQHAKQGCKETKYQTGFQVVFFKYHSFQAFSSFSFKT